MARTRTLVLLRAEVRDRADIEGSGHITDTQITRYLNQSCAALHALMVEAGEDYFTTTTSLTAGTAVPGAVTATAVPADFYKEVQVSVSLAGGLFRCERYDYSRLNDLLYPPRTATGGEAPRYRIVGSSVHLAPPPPTSTAIQFVYVRAFVDMSADGDTFDGRDGWEEWVTWDAAIKCLVKEESDIREAVAERDRVFARIMSQIKTVDLGAPDRVVDRARDAPWADEIRAGKMAPT